MPLFRKRSLQARSGLRKVTKKILLQLLPFVVDLLEKLLTAVYDQIGSVFSHIRSNKEV